MGNNSQLEEAEALLAGGEVQAGQVGAVGLVTHPSEDIRPIPHYVASKVFGGGFSDVKRLLYATELVGSDGAPRYRCAAGARLREECALRGGYLTNGWHDQDMRGDDGCARPRRI